MFGESCIDTAQSVYVSKVKYADDNSVTDSQWVDADGIHPLAYGYLHGYVPIVRRALGLGGDDAADPKVIEEIIEGYIAKNPGTSQGLPLKLPNPYALTINGQSYDGSEAVEINVQPKRSYKFIEKREISETGVSSVLFDGLNLDALIVYISVPMGSTDISVGAAVYKNSVLAGYGWLATLVSSTSARIASVVAKNENGLAFFEYAGPANNTNSVTKVQAFSALRNCSYVEGINPFTKISFDTSTSVELPMGTTFELWGMEPDA